MTEDLSPDDERFDEIVADFLDAVADGQPIDESKWLTDYPEFAEQLKIFFADHRRMGGLMDGSPVDTLPSNATPYAEDRTRASGDAPTIAGNSPESRAVGYGYDPEKCIDDYALLEKIAEGGMGVVYKAKQLSLNRLVAIKMIRTGEFADAEEIQRFRVEAEAAARLTHPGIVPIYQIGEDKGQHFFSMSLVEGSSLAEMIRQEPMKPRRAAEYVSKVASAVHYAHEQGIIHRDIKPANVLVDKNNQPKVTDFGLAKQITSDHQLTMSGQILGTASYMSPEQAAGREVTPLADVYSLGALLYTLLTKQPPFTGANPVDILLDVLSKDPASPSTLNISISRDLETICMRCLEKEPQRRYESASALADDLGRFLDGTPIVARPVGRIERWIRWCQRKPTTAISVLLAGLLVIAITVDFVKPSVRNFFATAPTITNEPSLLDQAREFYGSKQIPSSTDLEKCYVLAGRAMLGFDRKSKDREQNQKEFLELADALSVGMNVNPESEPIQSALADCLLQLVRFHVPDPTRENERYRPAVVDEEDMAKVSVWLARAIEIMASLHSRYPNNDKLAARFAATRATQSQLPGEDRFSHFKAAAEIHPKFDTSQGLIRFDLGEISRDNTNVDSESDDPRELTEILDLAHSFSEQEKHQEAIEAYQQALTFDSIPARYYRNAFVDLSFLAEQESGAVKFMLASKWPQRAEAFYYAVLGIRQSQDL